MIRKNALFFEIYKNKLCEMTKENIVINYFLPDLIITIMDQNMYFEQITNKNNHSKGKQSNL